MGKDLSLAGGGEGGQVIKESSLLPVDQTKFGMESSLMPLELKGNAQNCLLQSTMPSCVQGDASQALDVAAAAAAAVASLEESARLGEENIVVQQAYRKEIVVSRSQVISNSVKQPDVRVFNQSEIEGVHGELVKQGRITAVTIPRYLNLEPSLAMDWLEISWDELNIKERVGAGISSPPFSFMTRIYLYFFYYSTTTSFPHEILYFVFFQAHLGQCIVLNGMDRLVICSL